MRHTKVTETPSKSWVVISMAVAVLIGVVGMAMIKEGALPEFKDSETIIVQIANLLSKIGVVPALLAGVIALKEIKISGKIFGIHYNLFHSACLINSENKNDNKSNSHNN